MRSETSGRLLRLGGAVLLGAAVGYGAQYVAKRVNETLADSSGTLDWNTARRYALRVSGWQSVSLSDRALRQAQYEQMVKQSEPLVAEFLGVNLPQPIEEIQVVDRRAWLDANFVSLSHMLEPLEEMLYKLRDRQGAAAGWLNGQIAGMQLGLLLGFLARRVLGQYDLSLLSPDPEARGALMFVEPNIARMQEELGLSDRDFRMWIALHEVTHVFQFEAYPWVKPYFNTTLREFLGHVTDGLAGSSMNAMQFLERLVRGRLQGEHWVQVVMSPQEREMFDKLQALMSIVEGYASHVMNDVGKTLLPSFGQIEARIAARQRNKPVLLELFDRITGMDLKLEQYRQGEEFVRAVDEAKGRDFLNRVWEGPQNLPSMREIREPRLWIARMEGLTLGVE
jgi:coenzyme F420 biosynthesis associated uncharacterized protein